MFDFAWSELLVIGAIALVVIGPKDLPKAMRTAGILVRRARSLAREFQNSIDDMIRESELDDIRRSVQESTRLDLDKRIENSIDPDGEIKAALASPDAQPPKPVMEPSTPPETPPPETPPPDTLPPDTPPETQRPEPHPAEPLPPRAEGGSAEPPAP